MPALRTLKAVFNGGELSPMLGSRVDSEKYAAGCKELTNFIPTVYGGVKKRPGTELLGFTKNDGPARLHGFKRSTETNYILEFGDKYLRFWKGGAEPKRVPLDGNARFLEWYGTETVVNWTQGSYPSFSAVLYAGIRYISKKSVSSTAAAPNLNTSDWIAASAVPNWASGISYSTDTLVIYNGQYYSVDFSHTSSASNSPENSTFYWDSVLLSNTDFLWKTSVRYAIGDKVSSSSKVYRCVTAHTGSSTRKPGAGNDWEKFWEKVPFYQVNDRIKVTSLGKFYHCLTTHLPSKTFSADAAYWQEIPQGEGVGFITYEVDTPYAATDVFDLQFAQLNDVLFIAHPNHHPKRLSRLAEADWIFEDVPFEYAPTLDVNEDRTSVQIQFKNVPSFGLVWKTATHYVIGDRVHATGDWEGYIYECIKEHDSGTTTRPGYGASASDHWTRISYGYPPGTRVIGVDVTDRNKSNGELFTCHTTQTLGATNVGVPGYGTDWRSYWNQGGSDIYIPEWVNNTDYTVGFRVRVGTVVYECVVEHTSRQQGVTAGGRPGVVVIRGNRPGSSGQWTPYWRIVSSDTDINDVSFELCATEPLFDSTDVGTIWLLEIGTGGLVEDLRIPTTTNTAKTTADYPLFIQGGYRLTTVWNAKDAMLGTLTIEESLDGVTWNVVRQFTQYSKEEGNILYNGEAPTPGAWYRLSLATAGTSTTATDIKLEAISSVYRLPFKITKVAESKVAEGMLIMPGKQLPPGLTVGVATSIFRKPAFSAKNGFPRTVAFHDSRLWWGGTKTHPTRIWGSQTEDYYNYLGGSLDTDGLDLTLATVEANAIQWMTGFNRSMVIGTRGDEWTVDSGDVDEALTPINIRARRRTRYGSNGLPPQLTGDALLWIRRGGGRLHEFAYVYERDSFSAPDLTLLADHLLHLGQVRQTAFVSCPEPVLWIVNGDYLLGMSYNREHNVTAWHKHRSSGAQFTSVASIYGRHAVDEVWFVLKRGTTHTLERFHPETLAYYHGGKLDAETDFDPETEACFVDASVLGQTSASLPTLTFDGFDKLYQLLTKQGKSSPFLLPALVDGHSRTGENLLSLTLSNAGVAGLSAAASHVRLGWASVNATLHSMNMEVMLENGTGKSRCWRLIRAIPNVWRCRSFALLYGLVEQQAIHLNQDTTQTLDEVHFSGGFQKELNWGVRSHNAWPCNLLGTVLKFEISG